VSTAAGPLRIAAAAAHYGRDLQRRLDRIAAIVAAARQAHTRLLVPPDAALGGYLADLRSPDPDALPPALDADAPEIRRVIELAADMVVRFGYTEFSAGRRWNAAVCVHGGGVLGRYRTVHQPPGEALVYTAGDRSGRTPSTPTSTAWACSSTTTRRSRRPPARSRSTAPD